VTQRSLPHAHPSLCSERENPVPRGSAHPISKKGRYSQRTGKLGVPAHLVAILEYLAAEVLSRIPKGYPLSCSTSLAMRLETTTSLRVPNHD
jgi:hypothetical protein